MKYEEKWINRLAKLEWQLNKDLPGYDSTAFSRFGNDVCTLARHRDEAKRKRKGGAK